MSGRGSVPEVSAVICTSNRADDLRRSLASVVAQDAPGVTYDVIVVDNGSTDATPDVVRSGAGHLSVTYVHERRIGLSHARNTGWGSARAPIVAYLDDDAVAQPDWIAAIVRAFREGGSGTGAVGGRIIPVWEAPRPGWLADRPALGLTMLDWSPTMKVIHDLNAEWLAGANLAFRRSVIELVGGFHPALGRAGSRARSSEDVYLERLVQRAGFTLVYDPRMCVRHRVPASRLTKAWFRRRYFWQGVSDAVMEQIDARLTARERLARAITCTKALLRHRSALLDLMRNVDDPERFEEVCWRWIDCGHIAGLVALGKP